MVRLILLLALLAGPAAARCFGPPLPKRVQFEGGSVVEILSHTAQDLTYRSRLPDGAPSVITTRNGLFAMTATSHGATYSYGWVTDLPDLSSLTPGFQGIFKADMTVEHATRSFFQSEVEVLRADTLTVEGCAYPVLVIHRKDRVDGKEIADLTLWLSLTLRFPLLVEAKVSGVTQTHRVTSME